MPDESGVRQVSYRYRNK